MAFLPEKRITVGQVLAGARDQFALNSRPFLVYLAVVIPLVALGNFFDADTKGIGLEFNNGAFGIGALIASVVAQYYLFEKILFANQAEAPERGARVLGFIGLAIVSFIGVGLASILLVIPGFFVAARWLICPSVYVAEGLGVFEALGSSWERTRGNTAQIALAILVVVVVLAISALLIGGLIGAAASFEGSGFLLATSIVDAAIGEVWSVVLIAMSVSAYELLSSRIETLSDVFT